jgi:hypothetical protein
MPGSDRKKKGGERKDKKNARMREDVQQRRENEGDLGQETDQADVVKYKTGSRKDQNQDPSNPANRAKGS